MCPNNFETLHFTPWSVYNKCADVFNVCMYVSVNVHMHVVRIDATHFVIHTNAYQHQLYLLHIIYDVS